MKQILDRQTEFGENSGENSGTDGTVPNFCRDGIPPKLVNVPSVPEFPHAITEDNHSWEQLYKFSA